VDAHLGANARRRRRERGGLHPSCAPEERRQTQSERGPSANKEPPGTPRKSHSDAWCSQTPVRKLTSTPEKRFAKGKGEDRGDVDVSYERETETASLHAHAHVQ
jgi:hypothetical protein